MFKKLIKSGLVDFPEYNWAKNNVDGFVIHPKSFAQGYASLALFKVNNSSEIQPIKIIFIYFDPAIKKGWTKVIQAYI